VTRPTLQSVFDSLRGKKRIALIPFIPAGYPDLKTTAPVIKALDAAGAGIIEIGFPFSDPIADGPVIQEAFTAALHHKLKVADIFQSIRGVKDQISAPLVAMVSYSIVFRYGREKFFADARAAGFDGLIIPDLPPPEAQSVCRLIAQAQLQTILLIAPTTSPQRRREIASLCTGFVYYLSVSGITGERDQFPPGLAQSVAELKTMTDRPICVGFGLHRPGQIRELAKFAQGAIVGSAIVRRMKDSAAAGPEAISQAAGQYLRELMDGTAI
jgi:tryptophan synthase alpha chain